MKGVRVQVSLDVVNLSNVSHAQSFGHFFDGKSCFDHHAKSKLLYYCVWSAAVS